jgi:hypothetical protein
MTDKEIQNLICRFCGKTIHQHEQCSIGGPDHPCVRCGPDNTRMSWKIASAVNLTSGAFKTEDDMDPQEQGDEKSTN